jgi:LacI family transcriptional regulator
MTFPFNENLIIKIEDVDTCEIIIGNYSKIKSMPFCGKRTFAVTSIKRQQNRLKCQLPFTDGIISKYSTPTITTVSQSGKKMGHKAAKMLIDRLELEEEHLRRKKIIKLSSETIL